MLYPVVAAVCAATLSPPNAVEGCQKLYEAVSTQYAIDRTLDAHRKKYEDKLKEQVNEETALATVAMYTVLVRQEVRIATGDVPFVQNTIVILKPQSATLTLNWNF